MHFFFFVILFKTKMVLVLDTKFIPVVINFTRTDFLFQLPFILNTINSDYKKH